MTVSVESIEVGVHLYDLDPFGGVRVYLPLERVSDRRWRCDALIVFHSGKVIGRRDVVLPQSYLSTMSKDPHV